MMPGIEPGTTGASPEVNANYTTNHLGLRHCFMNHLGLSHFVISWFLMRHLSLGHFISSQFGMSPVVMGMLGRVSESESGKRTDNAGGRGGATGTFRAISGSWSGLYVLGRHWRSWVAKVEASSICAQMRAPKRRLKASTLTIIWAGR
eukprot:scaffold10360_cov57-Attheya_sp.AAC.2